MSKKNSRRRLGCRVEGESRARGVTDEATVAELAAKYQFHPHQFYALEEAAARRRGCGFLRRDRQGGEPEAEISELYAKIGLGPRLSVFGHGDGLAQPLRPGVTPVEDD